MLTEEEFRTEVADSTLGVIELRLRQQSVDTARFARAVELQKFLLQRLVVALEGNGLAYGWLPEEEKLEMEDKANGLYKVDESEEGSDKESGGERVWRKSELGSPPLYVIYKKMLLYYENWTCLLFCA